MSDKERQKKDGGRKDKNNQAMREAESDPQPEKFLFRRKNDKSESESSPRRSNLQRRDRR